MLFAVTEPDDLLAHTSLYREFLAEKEEILKHKWIESEKAGYDIGFERALTDWVVKHRAGWLRWRRRLSGGGSSSGDATSPGAS